MRLLLLAFAALLALPGRAQTPASGAAQPGAYDGPRYPGGPDSLRALLLRSTRLAPAGSAGRLALHLELSDDGKPAVFKMIPPGPKPTPEQVAAATSALAYLKANMLAWEPGTANTSYLPGRVQSVELALDFTAATAPRPYAYADQWPAFPGLVVSAYPPIRNAKPTQETLDSSPKNVLRYLHKLVRYPPAALRQGLQGTVYVYFEVSEQGVIGRPEILGSVGEALDIEVLKAAKKLPPPTAPAMLQGQPVRVYYLLPATFKIQ